MEPARRTISGRWIWLLLPALAVAGLLLARRPRTTPAVCGPDVPCPDSTFVAKDSLGQGEVLAGLLARWCLSADCINQVYSALLSTDFNFRAMRPGDVVSLVYRGLDLAGVVYRKNPVTFYRVRFDSTGPMAAKETRPVDTVRVVVRGAIQGSLWNTLLALGEKPALVVTFAELLSYEVDFLTEVNEGDSFEILLDKYYVDSIPYQDGRVYAVRYQGRVGNYHGFYYRSPSGRSDYYNEKGQSLRKTVLRSPLTFANVTSRFGMRFHPIHRVYRRHQGVDYGAPTGTPVSVIADGTVTAAAWRRGYGRLVEIRHSSGLSSRYGHLSRLGAGIQPGRRVRQGQTIGYVGMTGDATGPHLHFETRQGGKPVNPLKVIPPRAEPVPGRYLPEFKALVAGYRSELAGRTGPVVAAVDTGPVPSR